MWMNIEKLVPLEHEQGFLDSYKEHLLKDYQPTPVYLHRSTGIVFHAGDEAYLKWSYKGVEDQVCNSLKFCKSSGKVINVESIEQLCQIEDTCVPSYGVCDSGTDPVEILLNILKYYPELAKLGDCSDRNFILNICIVDNEGFRPHKFGGYKGKLGDSVPEYLKESVVKEYSVFSVMEVKYD